jgi:hypothetical protein
MEDSLRCPRAADKVATDVGRCPVGGPAATVHWCAARLQSRCALSEGTEVRPVF